MLVKAKFIIDVLDVQINVYKRDTKYLIVSTDTPHRTIRINTATICFFGKLSSKPKAL